MFDNYYYKLEGDSIFRTLEPRLSMSSCLLNTDINICGIRANISTVICPLVVGADEKEPVIMETKIFCRNIEELGVAFLSRNTSLRRALDSHTSAVSFATGCLMGYNYKVNGDFKRLPQPPQ